MQRHEEMEREKDKIKKELEDQERVMIIQQYLEDVYSQHNTELHGDEGTMVERERLPRSYKVTTKGRLYSLLPRSPAPTQSASPKVITKAVPILSAGNQAARVPIGGRVGERKVAFRGQGGEKNGIRYLNDWNKSAFISYMNSEAEGKDGETEEDPSLKVGTTQK